MTLPPELEAGKYRKTFFSFKSNLDFGGEVFSVYIGVMPFLTKHCGLWRLSGPSSDLPSPATSYNFASLKTNYPTKN